MPLAPTFPGYSLSDAFGNLLFVRPVTIASPPGETNRLFVVERAGRIIVITNLTAPTETIFLDLTAQTQSAYIESGMLGLAFHPGFATNGFFYVYRTLYAGDELGVFEFRDRLARFQVNPTDPNHARPESEVVLIDQYDDSAEHNAGDVHFGPDGYLYYSVGDVGPSLESLANKQPIDAGFFGGIFRIDVDMRAESLAPNPHKGAVGSYRIPRDNPFIGLTSYQGWPLDQTKLRTEFYAVGFRNPFKFSFDPLTGQLYCGDVGGTEIEEVNLVVKGGNYGWPFREGGRTPPYLPQAPVGFTSLGPIASLEHGRSSTNSVAVIGGIVYRGARIPQLNGAYIFGDNLNGSVWSLRYDGSTNAQPYSFLTSEAGIAGFGIDPANGDVLVVNHRFGTLKRLVYVPPEEASPFPATLADTGAFANLATLEPNPGLVPYTINVPFWSDNATKTRWFSIPNNNLFSFQPEAPSGVPAGTVWVKHFELEMTNGVAASRRRLETRFLVKNADGAYGVTYRWNEAQQNAFLVGPDGLDEALPVHDGGTIRTQVWRYPSRAECFTCHSRSGVALGFNTAQLNCSILDHGTSVNQILALSQAGYFSEPVTNTTNLRVLAKATDANFPLEHRARSYFAVNCSQCHTGTKYDELTTSWDARISTSLKETALLNGRFIIPHDTRNSYLLNRISSGGVLMPPIATTVINREATNLVQQWINSFPSGPWQPTDVPQGETLPREGSTSVEGDVFTLSASGSGIGGTGDQFHFLSQPLSNNLAIVARLTRQQSSDPSAKVGVMLRQDLATNAPYAFTAASGAGGSLFEFRSNTGAVSSSSAGSVISTPVWLKLLREENNLSGFESANGSNWLLVGTTTLALPTRLLAGMAATSHDSYSWNQATFDHVSLLSIAVPQPSAGDSLPIQLPVTIEANVTTFKTTVRQLEFLVDGVRIATVTNAAFGYSWTNGLAGTHSLSARVTDTNDLTVTSAPVQIRLLPVASVALFNGIDQITQGNWNGRFGSEGFLVIGDSTNLPAFASVTVSPVGQVFGENPAGNSPVLQPAAPSTVPTTWSNQTTVIVNLLDGRSHLLSLYLLNGAPGTIELLDSTGLRILDTREVSSFETGVYITWRVAGPVQVRLSPALGSLLGGVFLDADPTEPARVALSRPQTGATIQLPTNILVEATVDQTNSSLSVVEFYANQVKIGDATNPPFRCYWSNALYGPATLFARAIDVMGRSRDSSAVNITLLPRSDWAQFVGVDDTTHGDWPGIFGTDGYSIAVQSEHFPVYTRVRSNVRDQWIWDADTDDSRALLPDSGSRRTAACWVDYDPIIFDVDLVDGMRHKVSLYFLDWDSTVRQSRIEIISASNTNLVLDTRELTDFHNGKYISWFVRGHVLMRVSRLQSNIAVSGLFFDPLPYSPTVIQPIWSSPLPNGQITILSWSALNGLPYRVEFTTNLNSAVWSVLPGDVLGDGSTARTWHQTIGKPRQIFYRVFALP